MTTRRRRTPSPLSRNRYLRLRDAACRRAEALDRRHVADGTRFPDDNPSSGMYRLVRSVTAVDPTSRPDVDA